MSKPNTYWLFNNTANDGANSGNAAGGAGASSSNWVLIDRTNDVLMFLDDQQTDGDSNTGTIYPVIVPGSGNLEAPKTFINDDSEDVLDQVNLAGTTDGEQNGGNTRYVFAIYFDGITSTIPYLECWDDSDHENYNSDFLGAGIANNSTIRGITTTNGAPGSTTWSGTALAGDVNRLSLDTGVIASAKNVYFNLKMLIPSTLAAQTDTDVVMSLRYTYQ